MSMVNPKKLVNSKWTAVTPKKKEKHFAVTDVEYDEDGTVVSCSIEAVLSKRTFNINWRDLNDSTKWLHGWQ
ncbi:MAG: TIGR02450 family Trp-rich protein [Gammaproteobacteria bacterium]|nr:TIGR02450 family Trp-rich protein [Gammaproteobacteria bacterium]